MSWSPDQEVVVFITGCMNFGGTDFHFVNFWCTTLIGSNTMILMSKDFDPLLEVALRSDEFGEGDTMSWSVRHSWVNANLWANKHPLHLNTKIHTLVSK